MFLSAVKKFGSVHVLAGRVLRVAKEHAVPTKWDNSAGNAEQIGGHEDNKSGDRFEGAPWVFCKKGDLVIEVVRAKKRKLVGYSYLTGPAIQLMNYKASPDLFDPGPLKIGRICIPPISEAISSDEIEAALESVSSDIKKSKMENDICLVEETVDCQESAEGLLGFIVSSWEDVDKEAHLIGGVNWSDKDGIHIHFQSKEHRSDVCANFFQTALLLNTVRNRN